MTLILATLTPRGAVLASDRRTMAIDNKTGLPLVLSDQANKIVVGSDLAIAVVGGSETKEAVPRDLVERWIVQSYDSRQSFEKQLTDLYMNEFAGKTRGGFVAVRYQRGRAESFRGLGSSDWEYDEVNESGKSKIKMNGSGNELASKLIDLIRPPLAAFALDDVVDFSAFLVTATHACMRFSMKHHPSVGSQWEAASIDYRGVRQASG